MKHGVTGLQDQNVGEFYCKNKRLKPYLSFACTQSHSFMIQNQLLGVNKMNQRPVIDGSTKLMTSNTSNTVSRVTYAHAFIPICYKALQEYLKHMAKHGHYGIKASPAGFIVHPCKCWLGITQCLDKWSDCCGIAEFKCPYSKAFDIPEKACEKADFYCSVIDGKLHLKRTHTYYHQVQLQLYVTSDMQCKWCDFCVYTTCGILVERIYLDPLWESTFCSQLDTYYMDHILPELVSQNQKPSYYM